MLKLDSAYEHLGTVRENLLNSSLYASTVLLCLALAGVADI
jgi:hypothetical protein